MSLTWWYRDPGQSEWRLGYGNPPAATAAASREVSSGAASPAAGTGTPSSVADERARLWARLRELGDPRAMEDDDDVTNNPILDTDSYKLCHQVMYSRIGVTDAFSYIESRTQNKETVFFGLQIWLKNLRPITMKHVDDAEKFWEKHIVGGKDMFPRADWEVVVREYGGYPPIILKAVPEGTALPSRHVLVTIECTDPRLCWMAAYYETQLVRAIWYPVTVASKSREIKKILQRYLANTTDKNPQTDVSFMLHDFGARGVSSRESSGIGGCAHLVNFMGSDTCEGVLYAKKYYGEDMAAFSVAATEHSIMTMRGRAGETQTMREIIQAFGRKGGIVSIVSDGYDIYNAVKVYGTELKQEIINAGITLVIRPDSGKAVEVVCRIATMAAEYFGFTTNSKGFKVLNNVRILQGDGLGQPSDVEEIIKAVTEAGFAAEVMVFGMGGGLLQIVNRDTYGFAMKTSWAVINGVPTEVYKDPITDKGKKSKKGRLALLRHKVTGVFVTIKDQPGPLINAATEAPVEGQRSDYDEVLETVYDCGRILKEYTFAEARANSNRPVV